MDIDFYINKTLINLFNTQHGCHRTVHPWRGFLGFER